jgi:hypothetical protein
VFKVGVRVKVRVRVRVRVKVKVRLLPEVSPLSFFIEHVSVQS